MKSTKPNVRSLPLVYIFVSEEEIENNTNPMWLPDAFLDVLKLESNCTVGTMMRRLKTKYIFPTGGPSWHCSHCESWVIKQKQNRPPASSCNILLFWNLNPRSKNCCKLPTRWLSFASEIGCCLFLGKRFLKFICLLDQLTHNQTLTTQQLLLANVFKWN